MKSSFRQASSLSQEELRALWRFRLTLVNLKPTVTQEQDFAAFARDFQWQGYVWILHEHAQVVGFFLQRGVPMVWRGRKLLCLLPEYGFLAPHLRGHPVLPMGCVVVTLLSMLRQPLRDKYVAASTYPPGYIAFRRAISPFWTLQDPQLPQWERSLLLHLAERLAGDKFRTTDGTVQMRTTPIVQRRQRAGAAADTDSDRLLAAYEAENPEWQSGRGLFFLFPLDAALIGRVVLHAADRFLSKLGRKKVR